MSYSARPTSTDSLTKEVNQAAHGFTQVGTIVTYSLSASKYVLSQADSLLDAQSPVMIFTIIDANTFYVTQDGWVSGIQNAPESGDIFTLGTQYYLSTVAGTLTATAPSSPGQVVSPLFVADSPTSGFFQQSPGILIPPTPADIPWTTVTTNTAMAVNNGYIINGSGSINMLLPPTATVGQTILIQTLGRNGFVITQNANQTINFIDKDTTIGVSGSLTLTATLGVLSGSLLIRCIATNMFQIFSSTGNFTLA